MLRRRHSGIIEMRIKKMAPLSSSIILVLVTILVVVIVSIFLFISYNALVRRRNQVDEAWSDITVQLKRRLDLIPNLLSTVKGYAAHEASVFEGVTAARAGMMDARGVKATAAAENQFQAALKSLFAVSEAYPDLKANGNFIELQRELVDTEDKIQAARRYYNSGVRDYNTTLETFPTNLVARQFGFTRQEFFDTDDRSEAEKPVSVTF